MAGVIVGDRRPSTARILAAVRGPRSSRPSRPPSAGLPRQDDPAISSTDHAVDGLIVGLVWGVMVALVVAGVGGSLVMRLAAAPRPRCRPGLHENGPSDRRITVGGTVRWRPGPALRAIADPARSRCARSCRGATPARALLSIPTADSRSVRRSLIEAGRIPRLRHPGPRSASGRRRSWWLVAAFGPGPGRRYAWPGRRLAATDGVTMTLPEPERPVEPPRRRVRRPMLSRISASTPPRSASSNVLLIASGRLAETSDRRRCPSAATRSWWSGSRSAATSRRIRRAAAAPRASASVTSGRGIGRRGRGGHGWRSSVHGTPTPVTCSATLSRVVDGHRGSSRRRRPGIASARRCA